MAESSRLGVNLIRPLFAHWFFQTPAVEISGKTKGFMPFFVVYLNDDVIMLIGEGERLLY